MKKIFYLSVILFACLISACKKSNSSNSSNGGASKTGSTLDLIRDSIYLYAAEDYLWNTSLPTYSTFNPRSFNGPDDITALTNEVNAISQYAINPATSQPYEFYAPDPGEAKYSFIDDGTVSAELNGVKGDFGFAPLYNQVNDLRIKYVYPGSPAALAGIKRGYQITSINGNANLSYDAPGYGSGTSTNLNFVINAYSNASTISMTLLKPGGGTLTVTNMSVANYNVNPVLKDTVYNLGNGHILGYMVFNSFTSDANADPVLNAAFAYFAAQGVTDLAIDLRYNGGGYVSTAEYIDNLIVPVAKNGTLMYNTYYNNNLTTAKDPLLGNQWRKGSPPGAPDFNYAQINFGVAANAVNFSKIGGLNVGTVFFMITGSTASASELTINNLRPVMNVQFIGQTSYGKPVGFFDIDINKYEMFIPEFSTQNSVGQGGYYSGMTPGTTTYPGVSDFDDVTKDFGDPTEGLLAHALTFLKLGKYSAVNPATQNSPTGIRGFSLAAAHTMSLSMNKRTFTGMIFNKKKIKKLR